VSVHIPVASPESISQAEHLTSLVIGLRSGGKIREKPAHDVTLEDLQREAEWIAGIADASERAAAIEQCLTSLLRLVQEGEVIGERFLKISKKCEAAAKQLHKLDGATVRRSSHRPSRN